MAFYKVFNNAYMLNPINLKRVSLCLITHKHTASLLTVLNEPEVAQFNDYELPLSREDVKQMVQNDIARYYDKQGVRLAVINNEDRLLMGSVGFYDILDTTVWLGFELSTRYWSFGYMYEVLSYLITAKHFETLLDKKITSIYARVHLHNKRSMKLLSSIGFVQEQDNIWVYN